MKQHWNLSILRKSKKLTHKELAKGNNEGSKQYKDAKVLYHFRLLNEHIRIWSANIAFYGLPCFSSYRLYHTVHGSLIAEYRDDLNRFWTLLLTWALFLCTFAPILWQEDIKWRWKTNKWCGQDQCIFIKIFYSEWIAFYSNMNFALVWINSCLICFHAIFGSEIIFLTLALNFHIIYSFIYFENGKIIFRTCVQL